MARARKPRTETVADDQPTEKEQAAVARLKKRRTDRRTLPRVTAGANEAGVTQVGTEHPDIRTGRTLEVDALGLGHETEFISILKGVLNFTSRDGQPDEGQVNEALQLIVGLEPRTTTEALLATQMAAVHLATMTAAARLNRVRSDAESINCATKALNSLGRTFAAQAEAMKKLKGGGQQKVTVEHKHYYLAPGAIAGNSQAILGDVTGGRGNNENSHQPHEHEAGVSERTTVHGQLEANGMPLPGAGSEWLEGVPVSWGEGRRPGRIS